MLAVLLRVSGRSFRGISFVLAFSRSVRRFGGISFPCQKILAFELLGRVLSPPLPRKVLAPRVADHNPQSQSQPNACDCLQLSLPSLYTPLISGLGPRRTPVGGAAPALKSERPLADCFKCSRSSRPLQGKQKKRMAALIRVTIRNTEVAGCLQLFTTVDSAWLVVPIGLSLVLGRL